MSKTENYYVHILWGDPNDPLIAAMAQMTQSQVTMTEPTVSDQITFICDTSGRDKETFMKELSEKAKTSVQSYEFWLNYCAWLAAQDPKYKMPWEDGFDIERAERVANNLVR